MIALCTSSILVKLTQFVCHHIQDCPRCARHCQQLPPHPPWPHGFCSLPSPLSAIHLLTPHSLIVQHGGSPHKQSNASIHKRQQHKHPAPSSHVNNSQEPTSSKHRSSFIAHHLGCVAQPQLPTTFQQAHRSPIYSNILDRGQAVHG